MPEEKDNKNVSDETKKDNIVQEDDLEEGSEDNQSKPAPSKSKWYFLIYPILFLIGIILSVMVSVLVIEYKKNDFQIGYEQMKLDYHLSKPKDVYIIPEFKLALDKQINDLMTTIVQVQLAIAYEKGDQKILNEIIHRKEQIKDRIQYVIASKTYDEINTARSREEFLKEDILYNLNNILNGKILDIYFDTFVISRMQD